MDSFIQEMSTRRRRNSAKVDIPDAHCLICEKPKQHLKKVRPLILTQRHGEMIISVCVNPECVLETKVEELHEWEKV